MSAHWWIVLWGWWLHVCLQPVGAACSVIIPTSLFRQCMFVDQEVTDCVQATVRLSVCLLWCRTAHTRTLYGWAFVAETLCLFYQEMFRHWDTLICCWSHAVQNERTMVVTLYFSVVIIWFRPFILSVAYKEVSSSESETGLYQVSWHVRRIWLHTNKTKIKNTDRKLFKENYNKIKKYSNLSYPNVWTYFLWMYLALQTPTWD